MKKSIAIAVLVFACAAVWLVASGHPSTERGPVTVGFVTSLSGPLAAWGEEAKRSMELAVEEINANGGIGGREFRVIYEDGACDGQTAASAAKKLIEIDGVEALMSYCSLEAMTIAPIAEAHGVVHLSPTATTPALSGVGAYTFRLAPSDEQPAKAMAHLMARSHRSVAMLSEGSEYSEAFRRSVREGLTEQRAALVYDESFPVGTADFRSHLTKIRASGADAVILNANNPVTEGIMLKQMRALGLASRAYGMHFGAEKAFLEAAGAASEGFMYFSFVLDEENQDVRAFKAAYSAVYPEGLQSVPFAALVYDGAHIMYQALAEAGNDAQAIAHHLRTMPAHIGLAGEAVFDERGDAHGAQFRLFEVRAGASVSAN